MTRIEYFTIAIILAVSFQQGKKIFNLNGIENRKFIWDLVFKESD